MLFHLTTITNVSVIARYTWISIMLVATFFANHWGVSIEQSHHLLIIIIGYAFTVVVANRMLRLNGDWAVFWGFVWDLLAWSAFVYVSGGATNPLITLFLTVIAVASITMATRQILALSSLAVGLYMFLWFFYLPLTLNHHDHTVAEKLHLLGMFGVFVFSTMMLTTLTIYYKQAMNRSYQALEQAQQAIHGQRRLLAVSSFAANIAHEMSTPIASMQLLSHEIAEQLDVEDELLDDIKLLQSQIDVCRQSLTTLKTHIQSHQNGDIVQLPTSDTMTSQLDVVLPKIIHDWRFINPHVRVNIMPVPKPICVRLDAEQLYSIVINILNNAVQAEASLIKINVTQDKVVSIAIEDDGHGISPQVINTINRHNTVLSAQGWGLGLTLAKTVLEYAGGGLDITLIGSPNQPKGTRVTLRLAMCHDDSYRA